MWNEYPPDYFDKDVHFDGIVTLFGYCEIGDQGGKEEYVIDKVFGETAQNLTWDEFITKCPDDVFGIGQKSDLIDKLQKSSDKVVVEWIDEVGGYSGRLEPINSIYVDRVSVSNGEISFDFRRDYEFYYERTIGQYWDEDDAWNESMDILTRILDAAGETTDYPDVWLDISFTDRDFSFR